MKSPARLSAEVIINLAENGVTHEVLEDLFKDGLEAHIAGFTKWDGPGAMHELWSNVSRAGGVISARMAREAPGEARLRGHRDADDAELDDVEDLEQVEPEKARSTAWWADYISGCPSSLEETVMALLDSGFTPQNCAVLREKLKKIVTSMIDNYSTKLRIDVLMSYIAFVVPG